MNDTSIIEILELDIREIELLKCLRNKWRFGEVTIIMHNGLPHRIKRVWENLDLTRDSVGVKL